LYAVGVRRTLSPLTIVFVTGDTVIDTMVGLGVGVGVVPPGVSHSTFCDQGAGETQVAVFAFAAVVRVMPWTV
jgi:hypothetical protein